MKVPKPAFYFIFTIIFCLLCSPAYAEGIYTVEGVLIEAAGKNATEARMKAIEGGEAKALTIVLERLNAPALTAPANDISRMVQSFEVGEEKMSSTAYRAKLTVSFNPSAVRGFLQKNKASYQPNASLPILVVPLFKQGDRIALWEEGENPWHDALSTALQAGKNSAFKLPLGDLEDIAQLDSTTAQSAEFPQIHMLAVKYGTEKVMLSQAEVTKEAATSKAQLQITLTTLSNAGKSSKTFTVEGADNETTAALLKRGAEKIIAPAKPKEAPVSAPTGAKFPLHATFSTLSEWLKIKKSLEGIAPIQKMDIKQLSIHEATIDAYVTGEKTAFQALLKQKGLRTNEQNGTIEVTTIAEGSLQP